MPVFNPKAYGWPVVKSKTDGSSGNCQQSPRPPTPPAHPGWILKPRGQPHQQSKSAAGHSVRSESATPNEIHKHPAPDHRAGASSRASNEAGIVKSTSHNPAPGLSTSSQDVTSATTPTGYKLPKFNKFAYGHPKASHSSQGRDPAHNPSNPPGLAQSGPQSVHDTKTAPEPSLKEVNPSCRGPESQQNISEHNVTDHNPHTSTPTQKKVPVANGQRFPPSASSFAQNNVSDKQQRLDPEPGTNSYNHVASRPEGKRMSGAKSPPATYETLKRAGETPEQVIARLQLAGTREVGLRMRRKAKGEPITTGLNVLDLLRKPLPPGEVDHSEPLPRGANALLPHDPNLGIRESQQGRVAPAEKKALQSQERKRDVRHSWHQPNDDGGTTSKPYVEGTTDITVPVVPSKSGRRRWATAAEIKAPSIKPDSNAEGSEELSDDDSIRPMGGGFGRLVRSREPVVGESSLRGWDGNMQPPPLDWEYRPRFYNNTPEYLSGFDSWLGETTVRTMQSVSASAKTAKEQNSPNIEFGILPADLVRNPDNHPDGIGFVSRDTIVDPNSKANYPLRQHGEVMIHPTPPPADFEARTQLDPRDSCSREFRDETAQMFIDRRMLHLERSKKEAEARVLAQQQEDAAAADPEPVEPAPAVAPVKSNIYLRPAVRSDFAGMARIYNWHISNGIRPSELTEITEHDMESRHDTSVSARLPVIVAVERNRKNARDKPPPRRVNPAHPIHNIDPNYNAVVKDENVVGWAAATDWSACDYIEAITAEIEIYVAPEFRKQGVGRCLMDTLLDATDRGYMRKGGYNFHVAPEAQHMYSCGGGRDLHKVIFQVRSFNKPFTPGQVYRMSQPVQTAHGRTWDTTNRHGDDKEPESLSPKNKDFSKEAKIDDREDDYTVWLKEWLESFGFVEEACLKKIGTKNKRFVDVRYLTRETCWQPADRNIPDFSNGI
ncbi:hypothetical protein A1O3_00866 [Capronia epimyces CBS 606.96]|uniref:N-acetyltransferase domain-containing protein n=1 Tax=Capronia epimyces CBS 606.96 TaxID=1182542 RepID=W9YSS5_9EURO|nr:uncharacterized protein A1O3_00866 [Capronia epimyces CBS 606.96]EXJ92316.1 hypothetical protein A1O3_00866 [Capronia epimyces CBS 606.96]